MSQKCAKMLFGGALLCAGLQTTAAAAQVSDVGVAFDGSVQFLDFSSGNESYAVSGGLELLPFAYTLEASASGYDYNGYFVNLTGEASWSVDGQLEAGGGFSSSFGLSTSYSTYASVAFASATYTLEVDTPARLDVLIGASELVENVIIVRADGQVIFDEASFVDGDSLSIDLPVGTIEVSFGSSSGPGTSPSTDFFGSFAVVPAPATIGLFAAGGVLAVRRRR